MTYPRQGNRARRWPVIALSLIAVAASTDAGLAQKTATFPLSTLSYADTADLALAAPIVAEVRIRKADRLYEDEAPGLAAGQRRYLIEADVMALIRGNQGLPPRITYLLDAKPDGAGRWPRLAKLQTVIFAKPVSGKPGAVQLVAPDAQQPSSPALAARVRDILRDATAAAAPPRVVGVGQAFHVPGTVTGAGETQIFLKAQDGRPLSLSVWRTPEAPPRWSVSIGEIVDQGAEPPARDTLLWYRLACALPPSLPAASAESLDAESARIAAEDYATVIAGLGACQRTRGTQSLAQSS